jgi:hypothetical protein
LRFVCKKQRGCQNWCVDPCHVRFQDSGYSRLRDTTLVLAVSPLPVAPHALPDTPYGWGPVGHFFGRGDMSGRC